MDEPGMTCFFPCAGAVLKTEGTRAQPTAVAPPPARQLGAAGEPPMPAPGRQGATASPDQVRLRGDPPSGARGSAVARPAGRQAGRQADGPGAARGSCFGRLCPPAGADARPGPRLPSERRLLRDRLQPRLRSADTQPRRPPQPCPPAGRDAAAASPGRCVPRRAPSTGGCAGVCASSACVCVRHGACASGDSAAAAPGGGQKFWGSAPQCWRAAEPAVAGLGQTDTRTLERRDSGTLGHWSAEAAGCRHSTTGGCGQGQRDRETADGARRGRARGPAAAPLPGAVSGADGSACNRDPARPRSRGGGRGSFPPSTAFQAAQPCRRARRRPPPEACLHGRRAGKAHRGFARGCLSN